MGVQAPSGISTATPRWQRARPAGWSWAQIAIAPETLTCVVVCGIVALVGFVGGDARWLAALGRAITGQGSIPTGVPFAAAASAHWHNAVVLAELLFGWLESALGDRGLMLAQVAAVAIAVLVLMRDARAAGASAQGAGAAVLLAALGSTASFAIARAQLFSLALFPILAALLRSETRRPSRRIWLAVPLIALWSNLHGGVLVGLVVLLVYLAVHRAPRDPATAIGVAGAAVVALCMTPAGPATIGYLRGLMGNEAAASGTGFWGPLSLTAPIDLLLIGVVAALVWRLRKHRPALWEIVVLVGLGVATVLASRSSVWLLIFLAVPAAPGFRDTRWWSWVMPPLATAALVALVAGLARGPLTSGAGGAIVARAITLAHGTPILASDIVDEQVALAGGRIWIGNPIDAFSKPDQLAYLDWLNGRPSGGAAIGREIDVALTTAGSGADRLMAQDPEFARVSSDGRADLFVRARR